MRVPNWEFKHQGFAGKVHQWETPKKGPPSGVLHRVHQGGSTKRVPKWGPLRWVHQWGSRSFPPRRIPQDVSPMGSPSGVEHGGYTKVCPTTSVHEGGSPRWVNHAGLPRRVQEWRSPRWIPHGVSPKGFPKGWCLKLGSTRVSRWVNHNGGTRRWLPQDQTPKGGPPVWVPQGC
jgi:hypothetical protein